MDDTREGQRQTGVSGSVAGGAAYANRNPLFRSPAGGDDIMSDDNASEKSAAKTSHHSKPSRGTRRGGRGDPGLISRSPPLEDDDADNSTRSSSLSGMKDVRRTGHSRGGGSGSRGIGLTPARYPLAEYGDVDDSNMSDISGMVVLNPKRAAFGGGDGDGGTSGVSGSSRYGLVGSSSSNGFGGSGIRGLEPAVKGCGYITTATLMKLITALIALWNVGLLWVQHYDSSTGELCSFRDKDACVTSGVSKILLTTARLSAGALFPSMAWCILSKCYASKYFVHNSWLSLVIDFEPTHNLHTYYGMAILLCSAIHSLAHLVRVLYEREPEQLYRVPINRSGVVAMILVLPTAVPMMVGFLKEKLTYEFRKMLHLLFIPFMVAICFHGKYLTVFGAILLAWYLADRLYFTTRMTFFIDRPSYKAVGRGTLVRFNLPIGYRFKPGAYIQVSCPAISVSEWHPFSLFPVPGSRPRAGFHVEAVGDWTEELFRLCLEDPHMPLWITAAQPSVLEQTVFYDNVVLVCTGAGITPAVSVAERFAKKKNVHLLWLSREASMIAMFEKQLRRVRSTVHLTGTPSAKTKKRMIDLLAPSRGEVVAATGSSSRPTSRASSYSDLTALEAGGAADTASILDFRGMFREEEEPERARDDGDEGSVSGGYSLGRPVRGGSILEGEGGGAKVMERGDHHRRPNRNQNKRARGIHPVSVNFGRPDVERFIAETILGTAVVAQWADTGGLPPTKEEVPPARLRQVLTRLNTNQRISKRDLMSADLSVVEGRPAKPSSVSSSTGFGAPPETAKDSDTVEADKGTWLVLYSGANAKVEQAVESACQKLKVDWRKEYFSAW